MKLTEESEKNIKFILQNYGNHLNIKSIKNSYLKKFYNEFIEANNYIKNISKILKVNEIRNNNQTGSSSIFSSGIIPQNIKTYVKENCNYCISVTLKINILSDSRIFNIFFYICNNDYSLELYKNYVDLIGIWLYFASKHSSISCSKSLNIFIYLNPHKKHLPNNNLEILDVEHVNSAFTTSCMLNGEILVFRTEEWFKVLIHETFHVFGLDFSSLNITPQKELMKKTFEINSNFNISESYCEFWARFLNILFFSYINYKSFKDFKLSFEINIAIESLFSLMQLNKILNHMGLTYDILCNPSTKHICKKLFKEKSNVFAYYVLTSILLNNVNETLDWCNNNNIMLCRFKLTPYNVDNYVKHILSIYNKKSLKTTLSKLDNFPDNSTRMTAFEFN